MITNIAPTMTGGGRVKRSPIQVIPGGNGANDQWTHILDPKGQAWAVGRNNNGQLGVNNKTDQKFPIKVVGNHVFTKLVERRYGAVGLKANGEVWGWAYTRPCDGTANQRSSPVLVGSSYIDISGNSEDGLVLLKADGSAYGAGINNAGQIGDGTKTERVAPTAVVGGHVFNKIATGGGQGYCRLATKANGEVWAWGYNGYGFCGDGTNADRSSPVSVAGGAWSFVKIAVGKTSAFGIRGANGTCWAWGCNNNGQLGVGDSSTRTSPTSVVGGHSFIDIKNGYPDGQDTFTIALKADGSLWAWGKNTSGQCGEGTVTNRTSPVSIPGKHSFIGINAGGLHSCAWKADGSAYVWGSSTFNSENFLYYFDPRVPSTRTSGQTISYAEVTTVGVSTLMRKSDGTVWGWGVATALGTNDLISRTVPTSAVGAHSFVKIVGGGTACYGLKANTGAVWSWGYNGFGQLGDGSAESRSSPVSVVGNHSFVTIAAGYNNCGGLKSDGTCWVWGEGVNGACGQGSVAESRSSPVSVIGNHSFTAIAGGDYNYYGLKVDGSLWAWGYNASGELGDNTILNKSSPISVIGSHSFIKIESNPSPVALKADGSAWCWGYGAYKTCGDGLAVNRSTPVSVQGNHSFIDIGTTYSANYGLKADGSIWAWGFNLRGQLGDNTYTDRGSPVLVLSSGYGRNNFVSLAKGKGSGGNGRMAALRSDGVVFTWGMQTENQDISSPALMATYIV